MNYLICTLFLVGMGHAVASQGVIERPDENYGFRFIDSDTINGDVRILIESTPSKEQYLSDPEAWPSYLYVLSIRSSGRQTTARLVFAHPVNSATLRRGHAEVITLNRVSQKTRHLQRWSIDSGKPLSQVSADHLPQNPLKRLFSVADGNIALVDTTSRVTGGYRGPINLRVSFVSPAGEIVASHVAERADAQFAADGLFEWSNGIGVLTRLLIAEGHEALNSEVGTVTRASGSRTLMGHVGSETRLLLVDGRAQGGVFSSALERDFMWSGMGDPKEIGVAQHLRDSDAHQRTMQAVNKEFATDRRVYINNELYGPVVRPDGQGLVALVKRHIPGSDKSDDGYHLALLDQRGVLQQSINVDHIAQSLGLIVDVRSKDGGFLLTGNKRNVPYVASVSRDGSFRWVQTFASGPTLAGFAGGGDNLWVHGALRGSAAAGQQKPWIGRVDQSAASDQLPVSKAQKLRAARAAERQAEHAASPAPKGPGSDLADQMDECACSCSEKTAVNEFLERMKNVRDAASAQAIQNSPMLNKMVCLMACQDAYSRCL